MARSAAYVLAATAIASSTTAFVPMGGEEKRLFCEGEHAENRAVHLGCGAGCVREGKAVQRATRGTAALLVIL